MKKRIVIASILGLMFALAVSVPAMAVGNHGHYLTTPNGETHQIAQGTCNNEEDSPSHQALENLHNNVHHGQPGDEVFPNNPVSLRSGPC